jgi:hypothetical protein
MVPNGRNWPLDWWLDGLPQLWNAAWGEVAGPTTRQRAVGWSLLAQRSPTWTSFVLCSLAISSNSRTIRQERLRVFSVERHAWFVGAALLVMLGALGPSTFAYADASQREVKIRRKEVTGDVTYVTKRAISLEYSKSAETSFEMLLPVNENTRLERVKSLSELKPGDRIKVQYQQEYKEKDEEGNPIVLNTVATNVALLKHAATQGTLRSETGVASE